MARLLNIHRITVSRKLQYLATQSRLENEKFLNEITCNKTKLFQVVQMDEMETFEHTKCKPLSIALLVSDEPKRERMILGFEVSSMPAKGPLAQIAKAKYGLRPDHRSAGLKKLLVKSKPFIHSEPSFTTDQNPRYPSSLRRQWQKFSHIAVKGRRGCIVGQGELKKIGFDPLFSLNHTCAMFRANVNRLFRKTWCTTKKVQALEQHLELYMNYHNQVLLQSG